MKFRNLTLHLLQNPAISFRFFFINVVVLITWHSLNHLLKKIVFSLNYAKCKPAFSPTNAHIQVQKYSHQNNSSHDYNKVGCMGVCLRVILKFFIIMAWGPS